MSNTKEIIIAGGGAAGMVAAIAAVREGAHVHLFEKNEKLGKKIFITGKGRCNVTNACDMEGLFEAVVSNPKFYTAVFMGFTNQEWLISSRGPASQRRSRGAGAFSRFPTILRM